MNQILLTQCFKHHDFNPFDYFRVHSPASAMVTVTGAVSTEIWTVVRVTHNFEIFPPRKIKFGFPLSKPLISALAFMKTLLGLVIFQNASSKSPVLISAFHSTETR